MTSIREASGLSAIGTVSVREAAGLSAVGTIKGRDATNTLVTIFSAFGGGGGTSGLTAAPTSATGYTNSHAFQRITTGSVTITVSPAGSVDSAVWTFADTGWEALAPSSLATGFRSPSTGPGDTSETIATCTVTRGAAVATIDVPAICSNFGA